MCNLYSLNKKRDMIARMFRVNHNRTAAYEPLSAIFPGHVAPVVRQSEDGERELVRLSWGFVLLQNGRAPRRVTNVRDDTILKSSSGAAHSRSGAAWCRRPLSASPMAT